MKQLRPILGVVIVLAGVYVTWRIMPSYVAYFQLEGAMDDISRTGVVDARKSEDDLRSRVYQEAQALNIDIRPEQIQVQRTPFDVFIWSNYTVHVDLPFYPIDLHFQPMSKSKKRTM